MMKFARIQRTAVLLVLLILIAVLAVKLGTISMNSPIFSPAQIQSKGENFTDLPAAPSSDVIAANAVSANRPERPKVVLPEVLVSAMSWKTSDLEVMTHPDGRQSMNLKGRLTHVSASVMGPDGKEVVQCFSNADALATALSQNPSTK